MDKKAGRDGRRRGQAGWRQVLKFYGLAIAIAWLGWLPLVLSRTGLGWLPFALPMPWIVLGLVGPPLAALILQWREHGNLRVARLWPRWRVIPAALLALMVLASAFVLGTACLVTRHPPQGWDVTALSLYGFHVATTFIGGPIFEEWGWRGYAQPRLQRDMGALPAALLVGLGWALWHLPLLLIPTWSSASLWTYVPMMMALSVIMAWGFNLSGGWIGTAILLHWCYNASSRVLGAFLGTAQTRPWPDPVMGILISLAIAAALVAIATRGRLAFCREARVPSAGKPLYTA